MNKIKNILHPRGKFIHEGWDNVCSIFDEHKNGTFNLDTFFESNFGWMHAPSIIPKKCEEYPKENFVAFIHNPFRSYKFNESIFNPILKPYPEPILDLLNKYCKGLFFMCLEEELIFNSYFKSIGINIACETLYHPLQNLSVNFSWHKFMQNKNKLIIQSGMHLRKPSSVAILSTLIKGSNRSAAIVPWNQKNQTNLNIELKQKTELINLNDLVKIPELSSLDYIKLYENNIFFLDAHDISACNLVLDCISTNAPIILNRLPANEEYLGKEYPLFFNSLEEAAAISVDNDLILKAHEYLASMDKSRFSLHNFKCNFLNSDIYKSL
jgi:hypothetical protein